MTRYQTVMERLNAEHAGLTTEVVVMVMVVEMDVLGGCWGICGAAALALAGAEGSDSGEGCAEASSGRENYWTTSRPTWGSITVRRQRCTRHLWR